MLLVIANSKEPINAERLADRWGCTPSNIYVLIHNMKVKGLLTSDRERRGMKPMHVQLTEKGIKVLARVRRLILGAQLRLAENYQEYALECPVIARNRAAGAT